MKAILTAILMIPAIALAEVPAEVRNPDVHQGTIAETICKKGYTKTVRPSTSYTNGIKRKLMREQGIDKSRMSEFELDHIVPLEVGGHPRNIKNFMLQPWEGEGGARQKDSLEHKLKRRVCSGKMSLADAQTCIWDNWRACGRRIAEHK